MTLKNLYEHLKTTDYAKSLPNSKEYLKGRAFDNKYNLSLTGIFSQQCSLRVRNEETAEEFLKEMPEDFSYSKTEYSKEEIKEILKNLTVPEPVLDECLQGI